MPYAIGKQLSFFGMVKRGLKRRCPHCGQGRAFKGYLSVVDRCANCDTELGHIRADDFPPYLTIFLVGHIVVPMMVFAEQSWSWSMELHMALWLPLTAILMALFLPMMKGVAIGLMWRLGLTGNERQ